MTKQNLILPNIFKKVIILSVTLRMSWAYFTFTCESKGRGPYIQQ